MGFGDTIGYLNEGDTCVVCGKGMKPGEELAVRHEGDRKLPICCPLCLEAYQEDPKPYLERLAKQTLLRELHRLPDGESPNQSR